MSLARTSGPFSPASKSIPSAFLKVPAKVKEWDGLWPEPEGVQADPVVEAVAWRLAELFREWPESSVPRFFSLQADLSGMIDEMFMAAYHKDAKARMKAIAGRMAERLEKAKVLTGSDLYSACEQIFIKEEKIPKAFRK